VVSPDKSIEVNITVNENSRTFYSVTYRGEKILESSQLGLIREDVNFELGLKLESVSDIEAVRDSYTMLHGKKREFSYEANQRVFHFLNGKGEKMDVIFRVSNDGVAFRYYFPGQSEDVKKITEELTAFRFPEGTLGWLQPLADAKSSWGRCNPSYEEHYLQGIPAGTASPQKAGWAFPALFQFKETWIHITETGLDKNYCGTRLRQESPERTYRIGFPQAAEVSHGGELNPVSVLPWYSPWRVITIGSLKTIMESSLGIDLAAPSIQRDFSWVKPGRASWSWVLLKDGMTIYEVQKKFIDYAFEMGWEYCLIDAGWDVQIGYDKMQELINYARGKNVGIFVWYNSSGDWNDTPQTPKSKLLTQEDRIKEFTRIAEMGVAGVKVDFFGGDGQSVIQYYHDILKDAAEAKLMVNFHGCTLPRGWQRTYPHLLSMEAIKGMEFCTFGQADADQQPNHCTVAPFVRNVFDPMDFTPTAFSEIPQFQRRTSNAFELALPVIFLSGAQHYAEIPEGMAKVPDYVKQLMKDIPVSWDETKFIDGFPGKFIVIARKKNDKWYVAGINGESSDKKIKINLPFITSEKVMLVTDGENDRSFNKTDLNMGEGKEVEISLRGNGGFVLVGQ
jgi:hypothetical protein